MTSFDLWQTIENSSPLDMKDVVSDFESTQDSETLVEGTPPSIHRPLEPVAPLFDDITILSLDISLNSTGYFFCSEDSLISGCLPPLPVDKNSPHSEVLLRRSLIPTLLSTLPELNGFQLDHLAWEDSFVGRSAKVARQLYALNTAPDEALLDGVLLATHPHRINNVTWKSILISYASAQSLNKFTHKKKVQDVLREIPWDSSQSCYDFLASFDAPSSGFQDRLDAFGIALAVLLQPYVDHKKKSKGTAKLKARVLTPEEELNLSSRPHVYELSTRLSVPNLLRHLSDLPKSSIIVMRGVRLGALHKSLSLPFNPNPSDYLFYLEDKK